MHGHLNVTILRINIDSLLALTFTACEHLATGLLTLVRTFIYLLLVQKACSTLTKNSFQRNEICIGRGLLMTNALRH